MDLLQRPTVAIVNSRKPRRVSAHDRWVRSTLAAVSHPLAQGSVLVSSLGTLPYELAAWAAVRCGRPLVLVLQEPSPEAGTSRRREWDRHCGEMADRKETLVLAPVPGAWSSRSGPASRELRDRIVEALADTVLAVEVRAEGIWVSLLADRLAHGGKVLCGPASDRATAGNETLLARGAELLSPWPDALAGGVTLAGSLARPCSFGASFGCPVASLAAARAAPPLAQGACSEIGPSSPRLVQGPEACTELDLSDRLFHYTRSQPGVWPEQRRTEYLEELASGARGAGHTGLDALLRILNAQTIHSSPRLIRAGHRVCCFTERPPEVIRQLAGWGQGQLRWRFEPYALGFRRAYAIHKGLRPVLHLHPDAFERLPVQERFRFQRLEPPEHDWTAEGEWRSAGDFCFDDAAAEDVVVLVPDREEAARVAEVCPFRIALLDTAWPAATARLSPRRKQL
jgi:hypothetical protein